jgi:lipopolysaccharide export system protein LptC
MIGVILWLTLSENTTVHISPALSADVNPESDYGMTNFTMTIMDEQGIPSRVIKGEKMFHYPKGDVTEIIKPNVEFIDQGKETWVITSQHGETLPKKQRKKRNAKGEEILLTGNVLISKKENEAFRLATEKLTINTKNGTAYTDEAVKIASPAGETNSVGLHATLKDETVNLHSRVKGQYDAPPTE